jgi:membrane-associated protein
MNELIAFLKNLMDANWIMAHGGLYLVALIVFAETGLLIGFFLPGDSLLFVAGLIIANATMPNPIATGAPDLFFWMILIAIAGIIGNLFGYWFGRKSGPLLFERRDTWLFKKKHIQQAHDFYEKKGGTAIILARFLPIVRTFAPIVAGVVRMDGKKFTTYNIIGSVAWVFSMMLAGYWLGGYDIVKNNLEKIVIGLILVTTGPVLFKMIFSKKKEVPTSN